MPLQESSLTPPTRPGPARTRDAWVSVLLLDRNETAWGVRLTDDTRDATPHCFYDRLWRTESLPKHRGNPPPWFVSLGFDLPPKAVRGWDRGRGPVP